MAESVPLPSPPTVHELRHRFKPHKIRLQSLRPDHPTCIRFHRACSWLERVETMGDGVDLDMALISQWIAFNALYGQWDALRHEPLADRECWRVFVGRVLDLDRSQRLPQLLDEHRRLVLTLFDDEHLSGPYWESPGKEQAARVRRKKHQAQHWLRERSWKLLLEHLLDRVYLLRCQLVHGAATYKGKLNRTSLRHCALMMGHLLPTLLLIVIEHGTEEDWGVMCYPPQQTWSGQPA